MKVVQKFTSCKLHCHNYRSLIVYESLSSFLKKEDCTQELKEAGNDNSYEDIFVPSCLCIVSRYPFFHAFEKILSSLYFGSKKGLKYPLECYISSLTCRTPVPPRKTFRVSLMLTEEFDTIEIKQPEMNRLPLLDTHFVLLPKSLSLKNTVKILNGILTGHSVVFIAERVERITQVTESIIALMFPFNYELVYIPVLPETMIGFLSAPVQFIAGVNRHLKDQMINEIETDTIIVDLDNDKVEFQEQTEGKKESKKDFVDLPKSEVDSLISNIGDKWKLMGKNKKKGKVDEEFKEPNVEIVNSIRKGFLNMFINMFRSYKDYIDTNFDSSFNKSKFIQATKKEYRLFMKQFVETQIFQQFIEKRVTPLSYDDAARNKYFDESTRNIAKGVILLNKRIG